MKMIKAFSDFMGEARDYPSWIDKYKFEYDTEEREWDRKDLDLCLWEVTKMDMNQPRWTLSKFDDTHEDGEYILFEGNESEMEDFVGRYIRENKINQVLDEV
jgi:hypothetical protein